MSADEVAGSRLVPQALESGAFQDQMKALERGGAHPENEAQQAEE